MSYDEEPDYEMQMKREFDKLRAQRDAAIARAEKAEAACAARDRDWCLAFGDAVGLDSKMNAPLEPGALKECLAPLLAERRRANEAESRYETRYALQQAAHAEVERVVIERDAAIIQRDEAREYEAMAVGALQAVKKDEAFGDLDEFARTFVDDALEKCVR